MDAVDVAVLRWLMTGLGRFPARAEIRESMSSAAEKLGVSESTVRTKVKRFFDSRFLKSWVVFINPRALGLSQSFVRLDVVPESMKGAAIQKLKLVDGVWVIFNNYGSTMTVGIQYEDEAQLRKRIELMSRIANSESVVVHEEIPFPPCAFKFKKSDLEIIRCVQGSPTMTYSEVGRQLQLSSRTVRRRLNKMVKEGALFSTLDYDLSKSAGFVIMTIIVEHASAKTSERTEEEIVSRFGERIFGSVLGSPRMSYFALVLDNIAQEDAIRTGIGELDGVRSVYADLTKEVIGLFGPFKEPVNRLLEKAVETAPVQRLRGRQLSAPRLPGAPIRP